MPTNTNINVDETSAAEVAAEAAAEAADDGVDAPPSHAREHGADDDGDEDAPALVNLADSSAGARALFATDEWFAAADNMILNSEPTFDPDDYCEQGKVMDGWESRRRRDPGHDWCVIRLAYPGHIRRIDVDTAHFTGNHAPRVGVQAARIDDDDALCSLLPGAIERLRRGGGVRGACATPEEIRAAEGACTEAAASTGGWRDVLPRTPLRPGYPETRSHRFAVVPPSDNGGGAAAAGPATHVRVNLYPDGGVARLRVWGEVVVDFDARLRGRCLDLAAASNGGRGVGCSNRHYGVPSNLIKPGRGADMGDGWETARHPDRPPVLRRDPKTGLVDTDLMDWCVLRLGAVAERVDRIVIDTAHFRGNFPESASVEGCHRPLASDAEVCRMGRRPGAGDGADGDGGGDAVGWFPLLERTRLGPDAVHTFEREGGVLVGGGRVSHLRVCIYPDGGLSRVRVFGRAVAAMGGLRAGGGGSAGALRSNL